MTSSLGSSDSVDARSPDRSLPGGTPSQPGPDGQGRIHAHDDGGTRPSADHLRERKERTALQRSSPGRSPVCGLVHFDLQELGQDATSEIHPLCAALHGRSGTAEQIRFNGDKHCNPGSNVEIQGSTKDCRISRTQGEDAHSSPCATPRSEAWEMLKEETAHQNDRISNIEGALSQIAQQLQFLTAHLNVEPTLQ